MRVLLGLIIDNGLPFEEYIANHYREANCKLHARRRKRKNQTQKKLSE